MSEAIDPLLERHRADLAGLADAAPGAADEGPLGLALEPEEVSLLATLSGDAALADRERRIADSFALVLALRAVEATPGDTAARDELRAQAVEVQLAFEIQAEMREGADPLADRGQRRAAAVLEALDALEAGADADAGPGIATRRIDLEATLLPVAWEISRRMDRGELPAIVLHERRRDLSAREKTALVAGATEHPSSLDRLLTLCATVSVKVAADLDLLGASWEMEGTHDPEDLAVDAAALEHVLELAADALELARNRTQSEVVQALTPVRSRLEALDGLLAARAPRARIDRAAVSVESALSLLDFDAPPAAPRAKPEPPPDEPPVKDKPERSSRWIRRRAAAGPSWRAPLLVLLSIALMGGAAWYVRRAAQKVGPSDVGASLEAEQLATSLPSATVLEVDPENRRARIAVGPEWERWDRAEQRRRVLAAVTTLADRGYSNIAFERGGFGVVATYHDGIVDLGD